MSFWKKRKCSVIWSSRADAILFHEAKTNMKSNYSTVRLFILVWSYKLPFSFLVHYWLHDLTGGSTSGALTPSKNKRVITAWSRAWSQTVITPWSRVKTFYAWSRHDHAVMIVWSQKILWSEITEIEGVITDRDHDVITGTGVMITP